MRPWIVLSAIGLVLNILSIILVVQISLRMDIVDAITSILSWVLTLSLNAYFFLVVLSFKKEIEAEVEVGAGDYQGEIHYKREEREMVKA